MVQTSINNMQGGNPLSKFNVGGVAYKTASKQVEMKVFAYGV